MVVKPLIYDFSQPELEALITSWGEPSYRSRQIWQGLYQNLWKDPFQFTSIPIPLRERLDNSFSFSHLHPQVVLQSSDGQTEKTLFQLPDNEPIETVLMMYEQRRTLCISTQAGCAMGCVFCATGQMGFRSNLSSGEIVEQVLYYGRKLAAQGERVTNVVVMGMGEPFHNYDATLEAIDRLGNHEGYNLGARRFTISTVGLIPMIKRFAEERRQIGLAVSLHAADDELRSSMLPVNNKYPINELLNACREYVDKTKRRITFEWALIRDVNDSPEQARKLAERLKGLLCHVNVIPLNPTDQYAGKATTRERARLFQIELESHGISCTIRLRRGIDIQAGCGQLAGRSSTQPPSS
jgi:23S rRNA (adenine2503-C2)-methyltransferase